MKNETIIEAALFSAGRPLTIEELQQITGINDKLVLEALKNLMRDYSTRDGALEISKVGNKYAMQLRSEFAEHVKHLAKTDIPIKLVKTAALIAYHQPIKQSDLCEMIGPKVYDHVKELYELGLIYAKDFGRTKSLTTTPRFAEYFGIEGTDKESIKDWLIQKVGLAPDKKGEKLEDWSAKAQS